MTYASPSLTPLPRGPNGEVFQDIYRNIQSGNGTVTTAGTPVTLTATATEAKAVDIYNNNNAAVLYVGGSSVSSTKGIPLQPSFTYRLQVTDLSLIHIDSDTNGATFTFTYMW